VRVHIVTAEAPDRILGRLARTLADLNDWTIGPEPNGAADLNYWVCYIEYAQKYPGWHQTPIAAYFTHYDETTKGKQDWWHEAAQAMDLNIVTARRYLCILPGKTVIVRPPVDPAFTPGTMPTESKPIVGLSGFIDSTGSGRKGEKMVDELAGSELGITLRATGQGWPVRQQARRSVEELPAFYRGLDVFLCASTVEGNPLPPLEALACGVPVVIPRDVGMLDDLPDIPGIWRYDKGDYEQMYAALDRAWRTTVDRSALRAAVSQYTPENWARDHERAIESLFYDKEAYPRGNGQKGMYCVAYREPARKCARELIDTFKHQHPEIPVALASTEPLGPEDIWIDYPEVDIGARAAKLKVYDNAPAEWEFVLYLDADIHVVNPIPYLWQVLEDGWDFVICKNPGHFHTTRHMKRPDNEDECEATYNIMLSDDMLQLNGGVFGFHRNPRTKAFFEAWYEEWDRWGKRDQAALLRALWRVPMKMLVLGNHWNTVPNYGLQLCDSAGIHHWPMRARSWQGIVKGRSDSAEAWKKVRKYEGRMG